MTSNITINLSIENIDTYIQGLNEAKQKAEELREVIRQLNEIELVLETKTTDE